MRETDEVGGDTDRVTVEVDEAEAALGVGVAQESRDLAVGTGDHEVAQGGPPGRVGPHPGEHGEGHGQRHPIWRTLHSWRRLPIHDARAPGYDASHENVDDVGAIDRRTQIPLAREGRDERGSENRGAALV